MPERRGNSAYERQVMNPIRILLAEDHELVRAGLRLLIDREPDMEIVGEAANGVEAGELAARLHPDLVVIDLSMPQMNGLELMVYLRRHEPPPRLLVLTANEDVAYLRQVLHLGGAGYVLKRSAAEDLIHAIRAVTGGERYLPPQLVKQLVDVLAAAPALSSPLTANALSEREQAVLQMIAAGHTNKEVAARLDVSMKTVETYKARAMQKLQLRGRSDIVRYSVSQGWLQAPLE